MVNLPDDAPEAWPVAILGVPFDPVTLAAAVDRIDRMIEAGEPRYVVTANVDFLVQARRDAELRRILVDASLVLCDGTPLVWASRWLGNALPGRAAGSDLIPLLLRKASERQRRIFFLGAAEGVADEAARNVAARFPSLPRIECYSPPFRPLKEMNNDEIARRIREARPDILLVSFGCPKQEKWIASHYRELGVPVCIGVGATIDFLAGRVKRAPRWMRVSGTEWLFRLAQEPRRLVGRYADDVFSFFPALFEQLRCLAPAAARPAVDSTPTSASTPYGIRVEAGDLLDAPALRNGSDFWKRALEQRGHCLLDLTQVRSIDSTGLALLACWQKRLAEGRRNLILFQPSPGVRAALDRMRLTEQFILSPMAGPEDRKPHRPSAL